MSTGIDAEVTWDDFFYYGQQDIERENRADLWIGLLQPARTFLYNRRDSVGIEENKPIGLSLYILARYNIVKWAAFRNTYVSNGNQGTKDRRIATSQEAVGYLEKEKNSGEVDLEVRYVSYFNFKPSSQPISIPFNLG
jgi:hypothetical protein